MKIYITRHGETEWNKEGIMQGCLDSKLTDDGIEGAKKLKNRLETSEIDIIISSALGRAYKTAKIIKGNKDIEIEKEERLNEINCGNFQGERFQELWQKNPDAKKNILEDPFNYIYPNGESLKIFYKRVIEGFNYQIQKHKKKDILIVAHGGTIKCITSNIFNKYDGKTWFKNVVGNCSLSIFEYKNNEFEQILYNDTSHL